MEPRAEITSILNEIREGNDGAADRLMPAVYDQLRGLARAVFADHHQGNTLQPTAVVHEAWMKLVGHIDNIECRRHFFAVAAQAMRQVLADHAKAGRRIRRGGERHRLTLDENADALAGRTVDLVDLHDALERLSQLNPRHARVIELRLFGSLTIEETARTLDVSPSTVSSDWVIARGWLRTELADDASPNGANR